MSKLFEVKWDLIKKKKLSNNHLHFIRGMDLISIDYSIVYQIKDTSTKY